MQATQTGQCVHHGLLATHQICGTRIGAELALTAEPSHHNGCSKAQYDVQHYGGDPVAHARTGVFFVVFAQEAVDCIAHHARQEDHKGVHDALDEGHGDHVTVGNVRHFVRQHGLDFFVRHVLQQACRHGNQGRVFEGARCKGIGVAFKDTHFRHANAGLVGQLFNGVDQPFFVGVAGLCNDLDT